MTPMLPLVDDVWFPGDVKIILVGRTDSVLAVENAVEKTSHIVFATLKNAASRETENIFRVGVLVKILKTTKESNKSIRVFGEALKRVRIDEFSRGKDGDLRVATTDLKDSLGAKDALPALVKRAVASFDRLRAHRKLPEESMKLLQASLPNEHPSRLPSAAFNYISLGEQPHWIAVGERQAILECTKVAEQLEKTQRAV